MTRNVPVFVHGYGKPDAPLADERRQTRLSLGDFLLRDTLVVFLKVIRSRVPGWGTWMVESGVGGLRGGL